MFETSLPLQRPVDPWAVEIIVVARSSRSSGERAAISRDVARGVLTRLGPGAYVDRLAFDSMRDEERHIVRIRAVVAASTRTLVISHWSAAVLRGLPVLRNRLDRVHVTTVDDDERHYAGLAQHRFLLEDDEAERVSGIWATTAGRTVVDIAGSAKLEEAVITADAALRSGILRADLQAAALRVGERRALRRIGETIRFAHPGSESAGESRMRVTAYRSGVEVPELQHRVRLSSGRSAYLDAYFRSADAGLEVDGNVKYLDPTIAANGTAAALVEEKWRAEEVRLHLTALGRIGWRQSGDVSLLRPALARIGVVPSRVNSSFEAYCAAAAAATPRRPPP